MSDESPSGTPTWGRKWAGRLITGWIESEALKDNPLGDPWRRPVWVYLPPGYDEDPGRRYPAIFEIQGMTGQLDMWSNRSAFRANFRPVRECSTS